MKYRKTLLLISFLTFIFFIFYSYLVAKERFTQLDFDLTVKFQDKISRRVDYPFSTLSVLGSAEITGVIWFGLLIFVLFKKYWLTALSFLLLPIALAIEVFGKVYMLHPAPPHLFYRGVIDFNFPSHFVHTNYSYPSGHMLRTAFLISFLMVFIFLKTSSVSKQLFIQLFLGGLLITMAVSRIYLGEHWTTDVVGGFLLGSSLGMFTALTIPTKKNSSKVSTVFTD